jgi:hypothetical protein
MLTIRKSIINQENILIVTPLFNPSLPVLVFHYENISVLFMQVYSHKYGPQTYHYCRADILFMSATSVN